jgi:hypothetical protein
MAASSAAIVGSLGASYRTQNFIVQAPTQELAQEIGKAAEAYRRDLAVEWLGKPMPNWSSPCPITAKVDERLGAGGATSFQFDRGEVFGWEMNIQGSRARVLDSVLPHEITHTVFATYFRRPLPRWADEGACTTVEHASEKNKQQVMLIQFLQTGRGIAFNQMFAMKDYPADVLPLYSQGFSLARFMIEQGGKRRYVEYVGEGLKSDNWPAVTKKYYGFNTLADLQTGWLDWVKQGSPQLAQNMPAVTTVAATNDRLAAPRRQRPEPNLVYRGQSEDGPAETTPMVPVPREPQADMNTPPAPTPGGRYSGAPRRTAEMGPPPGFAEPPSAPPPATPGVPTTVEARRPGQVILEWTRSEESE